MYKNKIGEGELNCIYTQKINNKVVMNPEFIYPKIHSSIPCSLGNHSIFNRGTARNGCVRSLSPIRIGTYRLYIALVTSWTLKINPIRIDALQFILWKSWYSTWYWKVISDNKEKTQFIITINNIDHNNNILLSSYLILLFVRFIDYWVIRLLFIRW